MLFDSFLPPTSHPTHRIPLTADSADCEGLKVIGAGLGRTGTASLKEALAILYGAPCYHMKDVIPDSSRVSFWTEAALGPKSDEEFREHFRHFAATVDFPACIHWERLLQAYPEAKVLLSVRDPDSWVRSVKDTILKMYSSYSGSPWGIWLLQTLVPSWRVVWRMFQVGCWSPLLKEDLSDSNLRRAFVDWVEDVKRRCPKDKLLVYSVSEGWGPLCDFLGLPVPETPFPQVNDTKSFQAIVNGLNTAVYVGVSVSLLALVTGVRLALRNREGLLSLFTTMRQK